MIPKTIKILRYDFVKKLIESQNAQTIVDLGCAGNGTERTNVPLCMEHILTNTVRYSKIRMQVCS